MEARSKLVDVAAFLDRAQRAGGADDFRLKSFRAALGHLRSAAPDRARRVLLSLSDPTTQPIPTAGNKSACGAWPGKMTRPPPPNRGGQEGGQDLTSPGLANRTPHEKALTATERKEPKMRLCFVFLCVPSRQQIRNLPRHSAARRPQSAIRN